MNSFDRPEHHQARADEAHGKGVHAFARLLHLAETRDDDLIRPVAAFLASLYDGRAWDAYDLRLVDLAISDDMLLCLDALRWGKADMHKHVPDGPTRVRAMIDRWGLTPEHPSSADLPAWPEGVQAKLVSCGHAPGYRDVTLTFDCRGVDEAPPGRRLELAIDRYDGVGVLEHLRHVHASAWQDNRRPIDAESGEVAPDWVVRRW